MQSGTAELYQTVWEELKAGRGIAENVKCTTQDIQKLFVDKGQVPSTAYQSSNKIIKVLANEGVITKKIEHRTGKPLQGFIINDNDFSFSSLIKKKERSPGKNGASKHSNESNGVLEERLMRLENVMTQDDKQLKEGCVVLVDFDNVNIYCQNMGFYFSDFWNKIVDFLNNKYNEPIKLAMAVVSEKTPQHLLSVLVRLNLMVLFGPRFKTFQKSDTVDEHIKTMTNFLTEHTLIKSYVIVSRDADFIPTLAAVKQKGRTAMRVKPDDRNSGKVLFTIGHSILGHMRLEEKIKKRVGLNVDTVLASVDAYIGEGTSVSSETDDAVRKIAAILKYLRRDDPRPFLELQRLVSERINDSKTGSRDIQLILEAFKTRGFIRRIVKSNITVYSIDPKLV